MSLIDYSPYSIINRGVYKQIIGLWPLGHTPLDLSGD